MSIRLDSIDGIPQNLLSDLQRFSTCLMECECIEQVLQHGELCRVATELDQLCEEQGIVGYHYTRAIPGRIGGRGLLTSRGEDHRREFIDNYGHLFSFAQIKRVRQAWSDYFDEFGARGRDGRVWFNFTLSALHNGGAEYLLTYFGGEQIYMPLTRDDEITAILESIGEPLIVESQLAPGKLHTYSTVPWGTIWLSSYHVSVNKEAVQHDVDAYLAESLPASLIVAIRPVSPLRRI